MTLWRRGALWLFLGLILLTACSSEGRVRDMDAFFMAHKGEILALEAGLRVLRAETGIRGVRREGERLNLAGGDTLGLDAARERFPAFDKQIQAAWDLTGRLEFDHAYLLEDSSFWTVMDANDVLGSDYGYLHSAGKPVSSYKILSASSPLAGAEGWSLIRF